MSQIHRVHRAVLEFLAEMFEGEAQIIEVKKDNQNWVVVCQVYEESAFIRSIGLKTRVMDRNTYEVKLDANLEIIGYTRTDTA